MISPTLPFPCPPPFHSPKFSDKPMGGKVRSSEGEVPRLPPYKYHLDIDKVRKRTEAFHENISRPIGRKYLIATRFAKPTGEVARPTPNCYKVDFTRATLRIARSLPSCLSIRLSVTRRYCV